jgi:ubiquinone biosynthesis UbiH/UbiF/VisC/COQ6 family hydroxylase
MSLKDPGHEKPQSRVWVRGGGVTGRTLALALAKDGLEVLLIEDPARQAAAADVRAYALNAASVALLKALKVWEALPSHAATPVYEMRVHGDRLRDAARLEFSSWEAGESELAWIVDAAALEQVLDVALGFSPRVERCTAAQAETLASMEVPALTAVCEGKASASRERLGVTMQQQSLGQMAIAARLVASLPHRGVAWQWFRNPDVLALLPLDASRPGCGYALIWSLPQERAQALMASPPLEFMAELQAALDDATAGQAAQQLGDLSLDSDRAAWPLVHAQADRWCGPAWVLVGDAAHVVHPLAGQGLNLGLADVATLCEVLQAREPWRAPGDEKLLRRYARQRQGPAWWMGQVTDGLLDLFSHPSPWAQELRNRGLGLVNQAGPLKRWLSTRAMGR